MNFEKDPRQWWYNCILFSGLSDVVSGSIICRGILSRTTLGVSINIIDCQIFSHINFFNWHYVHFWMKFWIGQKTCIFLFYSTSWLYSFIAVISRYYTSFWLEGCDLIRTNNDYNLWIIEYFLQNTLMILYGMSYITLQCGNFSSSCIVSSRKKYKISFRIYS